MLDLRQVPGSQERLLLVAALGDESAARAAWLRVAKGLDIDVVAHETHGIFGQLAENLRRVDLSPSILPRLDGVRKRLWANNSQRIRSVLTARQQLLDAGISAEPAGGLAVVLRVGDPAARPLVDAELRIDHSDVDKATALLVGHGWSQTLRRRDGWLLDLQSSTFVDAGRGLTLRWRVGGWPYATAADPLTSAPTGERVRLSTAPSLLAYTLIEGFHLWGYNPTRRYADAMLLIRDMEATDWPELARLARDRHASTVVAAALAVLNDDLSTPVPMASLSELAATARQSGRRGSAVAARSGTCAAFLRRTESLSTLAAAAAAPAFVREVWDVRGWREFPRITYRRLIDRHHRAAAERESSGQVVQ